MAKKGDPMKTNLFKTLKPYVKGNKMLRVPQVEMYEALEGLIKEENYDRELSVIMPVGCGKSGCIALAPFAFQSTRTLVVAPNLKIAEQLLNDFGKTESFYRKFDILSGNKFPEPVEIRGLTTNRIDMDLADVVITNIHQLRGDKNRWLHSLPEDYFDLILFDEGHHSVADSWYLLKKKFKNARIVNFSATHSRADGLMMPGKIIYDYSVAEAIQNGYAKRLKAIVLNPKTLKFVTNEGGPKTELELKDVIRLGEKNPAFRRSILSSEESLKTFIEVSIKELKRIRRETNDPKHKIIATAINLNHCKQIVEAYRSKGQRCDFVHSSENNRKNENVHRKLERHELDVIVQVKKLGEGFDHPYLSVAAVFSIFLSLAPFIQFVGRIMRAIAQNDPYHPLNQGTVVFHAGTNIHDRWIGFKEFSQKNQKFYGELFPMEELNFSDESEIEITSTVSQSAFAENTKNEEFSSEKDEQKNEKHVPHPSYSDSVNSAKIAEKDSVFSMSDILIVEQTDITTETIPLIDSSTEVLAAIECLRKNNVTGDQAKQILESDSVASTTPKYIVRQNSRKAIRKRVEDFVERELTFRTLQPNGYELDVKHQSKTNQMILESQINAAINQLVNRKAGTRHEYSQVELDLIDSTFEETVTSIISSIFNQIN
ncbi:DEAD/DEAH box helicase [Leptospira santarosai]|uniref:Type III restriction enzyme, res subunit n=1 Tax=Leptospira santarosai serovar Arenal str. MAVJ 401 TaxID=1049976 RepID=M6JN81_9LEPT|nr:DEAD/DEAH box helicase family protein [Leptospira santarosai]EMN21068.1 type III restriction enzyme, res subunit [Leptospira santarosai serovar Arenal str. MAVJ 401]